MAVYSSEGHRAVLSALDELYLFHATSGEDGAAERPKATALPQFAMSPVPAEEMDVGFAVELPAAMSLDDAVLQLQVVVE